MVADTAQPIPKPKLFQNIRNYFREYCNATSIHGFRYFGEKRTVFEKLWWFVIFMLCLASCVFVIYLVYQKWANSPIIVSFATRSMPIYKIPFPAVTVCSESKIRQTEFNYTDMIARKRRGKMLSEKEEKIVNHLGGFVCNYLDDIEYNNTTVKQTDDLLDLIEEVSPNFFPVNCKVFGLPVWCKGYFFPILTDEGVCYTSNMLDRTELFREDVELHKNYLKKDENWTTAWTIEKGYDEGIIDAHPVRALLSGGRYSLSFELKTKTDDTDETCRDSLEGYKVLLHIPVRYPLLTQQYISIPLDRSTSLAIKPTTITTSESVKRYSAEQRRCYFSSEKTLKFFKIYTAFNCQFECLVNITLSVCSCVPFYMPRENGTRICNVHDYQCTRNAEYNLKIMELVSSIDPTLQEEGDHYIDCKCLPMCTDIDYNVVTSQTNWNWAEIKSSETTKETSGSYRWSRVSVYFVTPSFIGSERNELYGPTDFLANFGGVLGLFTGFSILSLMEIIYFLSIRIVCNWKMFGFWAGPEN